MKPKLTAFLITASLYAACSQAADPVVFTVPLSIDNLKPEFGATPSLMISCGIKSPSGPEKGLTKQLVPLTMTGAVGDKIASYHGQMQISVSPSNPSAPFVKGDLYICSLNAGNGWANTFNNYLSVNKPSAGQPLHMWYGGSLN